MKKYMQMRAENNWQNLDLAYCFLFILYFIFSNTPTLFVKIAIKKNCY